jgi:enoyl-CoA hydratase/carnithine racemase
MLARAPGRLGEYLGTTGARMDAGNAIYAGFADCFVPQGDWPALVQELVKTGNAKAVDRYVCPAPDASFADLQNEIDRHFASTDVEAVMASLLADEGDFTAAAVKMLEKKSPLSAAATPTLIERVRIADTIEAALAEEYKFTYRAAEFGDFIEGIKATIIDRTHTPNWRFATLADVDQSDIDRMLAPLGENAL